MPLLLDRLLLSTRLSCYSLSFWSTVLPKVQLNEAKFPIEKEAWNLSLRVLSVDTWFTEESRIPSPSRWFFMCSHVRFLVLPTRLWARIINPKQLYQILLGFLLLLSHGHPLWLCSEPIPTLCRPPCYILCNTFLLTLNLQRRISSEIKNRLCLYRNFEIGFLYLLYSLIYSKRTSGNPRVTFIELSMYI